MKTRELQECTQEPGQGSRKHPMDTWLFLATTICSHESTPNFVSIKDLPTIASLNKCHDPRRSHETRSPTCNAKGISSQSNVHPIPLEQCQEKSNLSNSMPTSHHWPRSIAEISRILLVRGGKCLTIGSRLSSSQRCINRLSSL